MTAPRPIHDEPSAVDEEIRDAVRGLRATDPTAFDVARGLARFEQAAAATPRATWPLRLMRLFPMAVLVTAAGAGLYVFEARRAHGGGDAPAPASPVTITATSTQVGAPVEPTIPSPEAPRSEGTSAVSVDALPVARTDATATAPARSVARASTPAPSPTRSVSEREVTQLVELRRVAVTDAAAAVELARAGHAEFPRGMLYPEREAILIDALRQSGHLDEARAHAAQFVERYPTHTATPRMRSLVDP